MFSGIGKVHSTWLSTLFCSRRQLQLSHSLPVCSLSGLLLFRLHNIHLLKMRHCSWNTGRIYIYRLHHKWENHVTDFANSLNCFRGNCSIMSKKQIWLLVGWVMCSWSLCPGQCVWLDLWSGGSEHDWLWISVTRGEIALVLVRCWQGSFVSDRDTGIVSSKCLRVETHRQTEDLSEKLKVKVKKKID